MRRTVLISMAAAPLGAVLSSRVFAQAPEKSKVTIAVGGKAAFYYLPLTIAEQRGYFKEQGLTVEIVDFAGGSQALRAVVGGSADVVSGAYEHTINMQANKQFFRAFVLQGQDRCVGARVVDQHGRQLCDRQGWTEARRCFVRGCGHWQWCYRGVALRADRRNLQCRSGHDHARAEE